MDEKKTFKLEELNQEFWKKVVFVEIEKSSGMGGPGCLWLVTCDAKVYFIGFDGFPYANKLDEFYPLLGKASSTSNYDYELENHGFMRYESCLVFIKEEYFQRYREEYNNVWHKNIGKIEPLLALIKLKQKNYEKEEKISPKDEFLIRMKYCFEGLYFHSENYKGNGIELLEKNDLTRKDIWINGKCITDY